MTPRVVVVTEDAVGEVLGGAAIRSYEIARALTPVADVTLAAPGGEPAGLGPARHVAFEVGDPRPLRALFREADVVITRPTGPLVASWLRSSGARIVYDLCDPVPLDILETQLTARREQQLFWSTLALDHFLEALHRGHHFICSGDRQRDLYVGALLASRLISPAAYKVDPTLRTFLDQVPFGIPSETPSRIEGASPWMRVPAIGDDAQIVLWNGGIWNWLDPVTAVAGAVKAAERNPRVRLVFMFADGALEERASTREARAAHALARRLGALDRIVFFNEQGVPFTERATWLLDAACVISTHRDHLEANFSFRTRLLDCFWVGVPAVCTRGDELSDRIEGCGGGVTVPYEDVDAVAGGILEVLDRGADAYRARLRAAGRDLVWTEVVAPLKRIVQLPGTPKALGDPLARRLSGPLRRGRAATVRTVRRTGL
jgi:glycosyltransferase involved in cell wall biosynthesis